MEMEKIEKEDLVKTNTEDAMDLGVGTIESVALEAKEVEVKEIVVEEQTNKMGKRIGDKVVLTCKHPDKDETIKISTVRYEKNSQMKVSGIWFNKDAAGMIQKGSALALMMIKFGAKTIADFKGKKLPTTQDEKGYLCVKAY